MYFPFRLLTRSLVGCSALVLAAQAVGQASTAPNTAPTSTESVTVTSSLDVVQTANPNPIITISGSDLFTLSGPGHVSSYLVTNMVPGVIADTADPYGLSFTRSINLRGKSDFFLDRTVDGLPLSGIVGGTTDLFDLEDVRSEQVFLGPILANQGFGAYDTGGVLDQTLIQPRSGRGAYIEQSGGSDAFRRSFVRLGSGELATGTALYASGSTAYADNWKGPGSGARNNVTFGLTQSFGKLVDVDLDYVHNEQRSNNYAYLSYAQVQNLAQYYTLSYLSNLNGVAASSYNQYYGVNTQLFTDDAVMGHVRYNASSSSSLTFSPYYWHDDGFNNLLVGSNIRSWIQDKDNYGFTLAYEKQFAKTLHLSAGYWFQSTSADPPPVSQKNYSVTSQGQLQFLNWAVLGAFNHQQFNSPFAQLTYTKGKSVITGGLRYQFQSSPRSSYFLTKGLPDVSYQAALELHPALDPNAQAAAHEFYVPLPNAGFQRQIIPSLRLDLSYSRKLARVDYGPQASTFLGSESTFLAKGMTLQSMLDLLKPEIDDEFDVIPTFQRGRVVITPDFYYYKAHNKDVLAYDPSTGLSYYQSNVSTTGYGIDVSAAYQITGAWSIYAGVNGAQETYDSNIPLLVGTQATVMQIGGKQVPNDPRSTVKGELSYRAHGLDANFVSRYISSRYGLADDSQRSPSYAVSDFNATYHLGAWFHLDGLVANLAATNLFNRKYIGVINVNEDNLSSVNYYAGSPRTLVGSVSYSFGEKRRP